MDVSHSSARTWSWLEGLDERRSPLASLRSDHGLLGVTPTLLSYLQLLLALPHASTARTVSHPADCRAETGGGGRLLQPQAGRVGAHSGW